MISLLEEARLELEMLKSADKLKLPLPSHRNKPGFILQRGRELVDFTKWDCLNIGQHPRVVRAAQYAVHSNGVGAGSGRMISGGTDAHMLCEASLAAFLNCSSAALFSSRNQATLSLITSFVSERDLIYVEESMQSPVGDAAFLVGAETRTFNFESISLVAEDLERRRYSGRCFIFFESLAALSARIADMRAVSLLCSRYSIIPVIDETNALGIIGLRGVGSAEAFNLKDGIVIKFGELSHGLGCFGGFVASDATMVSYLINRSRAFRNEVPLPPAMASAINEALSVSEGMAIERRKIGFLASRLRQAFSMMGLAQTGSEAVPFVSLRLDSYVTGLRLADFLLQRGYLVEVLNSSGLLSDSSVIRIIPNCIHDESIVDGLANCISEVLPRIRA